jgi:hypothetical protein
MEQYNNADGEYGHPWDISCCDVEQSKTFVYGLLFLGLSDILDAFFFYVHYGKCFVCGQITADIIHGHFPRPRYIESGVYQTAM